MKLGYAQKTITPGLERPVYLAGFGRNRVAESVHDDLYARALALSDGSLTLVLCALDLISLFRDAVTEIIQQVHQQSPEVRVILAATHTHHGPDTMGLYGPDDKTSGVDPQVLAMIQEQTISVILDSLALNREAVSLRTAAVQVPGVAKNARDPEIRDEELTCAQFACSDGQPLVTVFNFPCHPEVLFDTNTHITSDYPGVLRREVEIATGAPCIFVPGALGGMMTPDVQDHSFEEAEAMGQRLAAEGLAALVGSTPQTSFEVYTRKVVFPIKLTNPLFKLAIHQKLLPDLRDRHGMMTTETNLLKVGNCWWVTVPGELLPKLGLAIKAMLRQAGAEVCGVIGLVNDELGYILPVEDFRYPLNPFNPGAHYEETMSISKRIGPRLMEAVAELLI